MIVSVINVILYILVLFVLYKQKRYNIGTMIIPLLYAMTAVLCLYTSILFPDLWHLTFLPFIYMFFIYVVLLVPLKYIAPQKFDYVTVRKEWLIELLVYVFIVIALYCIYLFIGSAVEAFKSGDWLAIRNDLYYGEERKWTPVQNFCLNAYSMLHVLAEVWLFYVVSLYNKNRKNILYVILLAVAVFFPVILNSIATAARGSLFFMVVEAFIIYYIFKGKYPEKLNRAIIFFSIVVLLFSLFLSIGISKSRFDDDASNMLIIYFGHSMNTFNYGVMDTIHHYGEGRWFLGNYYNYLFPSDLKIDSMDSALGTHMGTAFVTVIGCLYCDFGPISTIVMAFVIAFVFSQREKSKRTSIEILYLYAVYASFLAEGVFVEGKAYGMKLIIKVLVFFLLSKKITIDNNFFLVFTEKKNHISCLDLNSVIKKFFVIERFYNIRKVSK